MIPKYEIAEYVIANITKAHNGIAIESYTDLIDVVDELTGFAVSKEYEDVVELAEWIEDEILDRDAWFIDSEEEDA